MRVEANCTLRWHEHDLNARVAADVELSADGHILTPEVLQHDGPASLDGDEVFRDVVNEMNAMEALIQAFEKAVKT